MRDVVTFVDETKVAASPLPTPLPPRSALAKVDGNSNRRGEIGAPTTCPEKRPGLEATNFKKAFTPVQPVHASSVLPKHTRSLKAEANICLQLK